MRSIFVIVLGLIGFGGCGGGGGGNNAPDACSRAITDGGIDCGFDPSHRTDAAVDIRAWVGTVSYLDFAEGGMGSRLSAQVTWTYDHSTGVDDVFVPSGTVRISEEFPGCLVTFASPTHAIEAADGELRVTPGTSPPTYFFVGLTNWSSDKTYECGGEPQLLKDVGIPAAWGRGDGPYDPEVLEGMLTIEPQRWTWRFVRASP